MNPARGEVGVKLRDGVVYPLLPTLEVVAYLEQRVGPLTHLAARLARPLEGGITLEQLAAIVGEGIRAAARDRGDDLLQKLSNKDLEKQIYAAGIMPTIRSVAEFVRNLMNGGAPPKEPGPATPSPESSPTAG